MSALKSVIAVILAAAALSACAGLGGTLSIDRFLNKEITGDTAGACMARSYQSWARHRAWVQRNYAGAVELAQRAEDLKNATTLTGYYCSYPANPLTDAEEHALHLQIVTYWEIAKKDPAKACACGNAIVEVARRSCAKPDDDVGVLQQRLDAQAAACEGR